MPRDRGQLNVRLDDEVRAMLDALQKRYGLNQSAMVQYLIRQEIVRLKVTEGFPWPPPDGVDGAGDRRPPS